MDWQPVASYFTLKSTDIFCSAGSIFLLPTFITGGKWDFQVGNLLFATVIANPNKLYFVGLTQRCGNYIFWQT